MAILIQDGVAWLPIPIDNLERLQSETREALGWKLEGFIDRAKKQIEAEVGEGRDQDRDS